MKEYLKEAYEWLKMVFMLSITLAIGNGILSWGIVLVWEYQNYWWGIGLIVIGYEIIRFSMLWLIKYRALELLREIKK